MKLLSLWRGEVEARRRMQDIVAEVAARHRLNVREILGHGRHRYVVYPRQEAMCEARRAGHTLVAIGQFFGGRHHTTVLWAVRAHAARVAAQRAAA